ncbi:MAG: HEAT repeat domain-containing protein [Armatimonadota bacterium]|nr:MAG: HEAT repeat domain-containing protein [Armatimonadota bacterium]
MIGSGQLAPGRRRAVVPLALICVLLTSLGCSDPVPVETLIARLNYYSADTRRDAAKRLGERKDPRAVEPLIGALSDTDPGVRQCAAIALGELADGRAVDPLTHSLTDVSDDVGFAARDALQKMGRFAIEHAIASLIEDLKYPDQRRATADALAKLGMPAVQPLIVALGHQDRSVSEGATVALTQLGTLATQQLIDRLDHQEATVREAAATTLGHIGDPDAVQPLAGTLNDESWEVRVSAATALSRIDHADASEALLRALRNGNLAAARGAYPFYIRRAVPGCEDALVNALLKYGDQSMALVFLNCQNKRLEESAHTWARQHGYSVMPAYSGERPIRWGSD